jgi:predicted amidohydrolase
MSTQHVTATVNGSAFSTEGWYTWAPREEIAPRFSMDAHAGRHGGPALRIDGGGNEAAFGEWRKKIEVPPSGGGGGGGMYRFTAFYRTIGVEHPRNQIPVRLEWLGRDGKPLRQSDYALDTKQENGWTRIDYLSPAPPEAASVILKLGLRWSPRGSVWWDCVELKPEPSPKPRTVTIGTVFHRPRNTASAEASVAQFVDVLTRHAPRGMDLVCLPEGVSVIGTGKDCPDVGEPVPGPTTIALGKVARELKCYLVVGLYERVGQVVYNTAVLLDRTGDIAGTYRKTHLPQAEFDQGLSPGSEFPVFDTDFGRVGLMICWDLQFPEVARKLAVAGAEVIALPIWGGTEVLARARAIENHVFLVSSSYDMKSYVVDPTGEVLAEATAERPVVATTVDLNKPIIQPWLGDMKTCTWAERRSDLV